MLFRFGDQFIEVNINDFKNDLFYYQKILAIKKFNQNKYDKHQIKKIKDLINQSTYKKH